MKFLEGKSILLIISGGIAAYKALEVIRLLRRGGASVRSILTAGGAQFITALSVSSLTGQKTYTDLWSLTDETEMGHIRLSREADLIMVVPASADFLAKMAHGLANDLASTTLLAASAPILIAPAMNPEMWSHPATQANIGLLSERGILQIGPESGDMACGETGLGRMSEPIQIVEAAERFFAPGPLKGLTAVVTSGPTYEPLDPVRFIGNRSSGKQGHAIAEALAAAGAAVTLVCGPVHLPDPKGVRCIAVETAADMLKACETSLPTDIFVSAAAVSDWRPATQSLHKIKKSVPSKTLTMKLTESPDILKTIATRKKGRPRLVVGFAAETENLEKNALTKLKSKGCDWILANIVGPDASGSERTFGASRNQVSFISQSGIEKWPLMDKRLLGITLKDRIVDFFAETKS